MDKPIKIPRPSVMDYNEIIDFIEDKYKIQTRDYSYLVGEEAHFDKYIREENDPMPFGKGVYPDVSGIPKVLGKYDGWTVTRDGIKRNSTKKEYDEDFKLIHEQYKRYQLWSETNPEPPYLDYWHWMYENHWPEVRSGSIEWYPILDIIENSETPEWVSEITQLVYDEFEDDLDDQGGFDVLIEW